MPAGQNWKPRKADRVICGEGFFLSFVPPFLCVSVPLCLRASVLGCFPDFFSFSFLCVSVPPCWVFSRFFSFVFLRVLCGKQVLVFAFAFDVGQLPSANCQSLVFPFS